MEAIEHRSTLEPAPASPCAPASARAFTLVELLVTVAVIVLLIGLLVPALGRMRAAGHATRSMSNLRQWGTAMQAWGSINDERIPWEGAKNTPNMALSLATPTFWPNAAASMLGLKPYRDVVEDAFREQRTIETWDDRDSLWNDPAAAPDRAGPWEFGEAGPEGITRQFWFTYAMNIRLNNTWLIDGGFPEFTKDRLITWASIAHPSRTVLMLELRAKQDELPPDDPHYTRNLDRAQCSWKRFAARHSGGGHLLFCDGHVAWALNEEVTNNAQGSRDTKTPNGDWNTAKYIFDPSGPARH
ncbi:MAG: prepilin-type N-terminal cleavage/methylation domain-containing protein [Planctomycetota bacterium]